MAQHFESMRMIENMRRERVADAEHALRHGDFMAAQTIFESISLLSSTLGDSFSSREFGRLAKKLNYRLHDDNVRYAATRNHLVDDYVDPDEARLNRALAWKPYLEKLQARATEAFKRKDYSEVRYYLKSMLAIAKKTGIAELIRNYQYNLKRISRLMRKQYPRMLIDQISPGDEPQYLVVTLLE
jgi:hypothetical protein